MSSNKDLCVILYRKNAFHQFNPVVQRLSDTLQLSLSRWDAD